MYTKFENYVMNKEYMNFFEITCRQFYYGELGSVIRKDMDFGDYKQEMLMHLCKTWTNYNPKYSPNTYAKIVIRSKTIRTSELLLLDKRRIHVTDGCYQLDGEEESMRDSIPDNEVEKVNEEELIEYILSKIPECDRDVCRLYLYGYQYKQIMKFCDYTRRQLQHRFTNKYKSIFQQAYHEYMGEVI